MTVFANGLEVSAKKQACKVIAAFPDTCFTPPQTPATPPGVPIPYPNFGTDGDMASGSSKVLIENKEISIENNSKYSKCSGDEAGAAPKKGILTSKTTGEVFAKKWSMDVKAEGKGVVRFSDIATTNHACDPGQPPPMVIVGVLGAGGTATSDNCLVGNYSVVKSKCNDRGGQAHHIIPNEYVSSGKRGTKPKKDFPSVDEGCCICVGGNAYGSAATHPSTKKKGKAYAKKVSGKDLAKMKGHGFLHQIDERIRKFKPPTVKNALDTANKLLDECAVYGKSAVTPECAKLAKDCIKKQFAKAKKNKRTLNEKKERSEASIERRQGKLDS